MSFCGKCGAALEIGGEFCKKCGTKLDGNNPQHTSQQPSFGGYDDRISQPVNKSNHRLIGVIACALVAVIAIVGVISVFGGNRLEGTRWVADSVLIDGVPIAKWVADKNESLSDEDLITDDWIIRTEKEFGVGESSIEFMSDGKALWVWETEGIVNYVVNKKSFSCWDDRSSNDVFSGVRSGNKITVTFPTPDRLYGERVIWSVRYIKKNK